MRKAANEKRDDIREAAGELATVRDFLRYAVSQFSAADLVYGHGTTCALDEAVFLILATLNLPIDDIDPWLEARLTRDEKKRIADIIAQRIETRKPAPYLTGEAWIGPYRFRVDERVIVPRSFIGELLLGGAHELIGEPERVTRALDLCTGSGCLAILLAHLLPHAHIVGADLSEDALAVARNNVSDYGLEDRVRFVQSDLFDELKGERFDLIISNPPYVTEDAVAAFPPEYAAEPVLAHAGGPDGLDLVGRILASARQHLSEDGTLIVEIGQGRERLESNYPEIAFQWLDTELSDGEVFMLRTADLPQ